MMSVTQHFSYGRSCIPMLLLLLCFVMRTQESTVSTPQSTPTSTPPASSSMAGATSDAPTTQNGLTTTEDGTTTEQGTPISTGLTTSEERTTTEQGTPISTVSAAVTSPADTSSVFSSPATSDTSTTVSSSTGENNTDASTMTTSGTTSNNSADALTTTDANDTMTTESGTSTVMSTTVGSTPVPTTAPPRNYNMNTAVYILNLQIGDAKPITSSCNASESETMIANAFRNMAGYTHVELTETSDGLTANVYFRAKVLLAGTGSSGRTENETRDALTSLNSSACFTVTSQYADDTPMAFAQKTSDACQAVGACSNGFRCDPGPPGVRCVYLCEGVDCGQGTCFVNLTATNSGVAECRCREVGMYAYRGDKCQIQGLRTDVIIGIIAGILGGVCFILFIVLICLCIQRVKQNANKYEMNGQYNEGYVEHSLSKL